MAVLGTSNEVTAEEFEQANQRAQERMRGPRALSASYDPERHRVTIGLSTGAEFSFPVTEAEELRAASTDQLAEIELTPSGLGLHFTQLDIDLYLPALLQRWLDSEAWAAARLGALGGSSKSDAKASAARENGRRGGRPRKKASAPATGAQS